MPSRTFLEELALERFDSLRDELFFVWKNRMRQSDGRDYSVEMLIDDLTDLCIAFSGLSAEDLEFQGEVVAAEYEKMAQLLQRHEDDLSDDDLMNLLQMVGWTVFIDMDFGSMDAGPMRCSPGMLKLQRAEREELNGIAWLEDQFGSR